MKKEDYKVCDLDEKMIGLSGNEVFRFDYERRAILACNKTLVDNFFKCAKWIKEHYPEMTETFQTAHDPYFKVDLIVENGVATLASGSHGSGYTWYLSELGTGYYTQGSEQRMPYLFENVFGFNEDRLVKFLSEWGDIKEQITIRGNRLSKIYSEEFTA